MQTCSICNNNLAANLKEIVSIAEENLYTDNLVCVFLSSGYKKDRFAFLISRGFGEIVHFARGEMKSALRAASSPVLKDRFRCPRRTATEVFHA